MTPNYELSRIQQLWYLLSAIVVGAGVYFRGTKEPLLSKDRWNRLDRYAPAAEFGDGSFPASDPPSSVPIR